LAQLPVGMPRPHWQVHCLVCPTNRSAARPLLLAADDEYMHRLSTIYRHCKNFYGLVHCRFINTAKGVQLMVRACGGEWMHRSSVNV